MRTIRSFRNSPVFRGALHATRYTLVFTFPFLASALTATDLLNRISTFIINPIIYVMFASAFVVFIWGLVQFVANLDNEESRQTGGKHMLWGVIGMVIMVGVNQIINIINETLKQLGPP